MHILFDISALCFFALVLTAAAIARHGNTRQATTSRQLDFAQHLFAAAEEQHSREPRTLKHQTIRDIHAKKSWDRSSDMVTARPNPRELQFTSPKRF